MTKIPTAQELLASQYNLTQLREDLLDAASRGHRHLAVNALIDPKLKQYLISLGYTIAIEDGNSVIIW